MSRKIIVISGGISSGKSKLAENLLNEFDSQVQIVKTRNKLLETGISQDDRIALQKEGDRLDKETSGTWVRDELLDAIRKNKNKSIFIVDAVRIRKQIDEIRKSFGQVTHIHLTAPPEELKRRYEKRYKSISSAPTYLTVKQNKTEQKIESLAPIADVLIDTNRCTEIDIQIRAASRIPLYEFNSTGYVDVLVGGQYGSEGKGQIAAYLSKEYDLLIRVGGPNAGHMVPGDPPYAHHQLPSGTLKSNAKLLLGPGMVINVEKLQEEISQCGVDYERLTIDPQAMIIEPEDIELEKSLVNSIGSTGSGVGRATSRKILRENVRLAEDIPELKPYIKSSIKIIEDLISKNGRIMLEGTQGTGLSIHHAHYPHVTSRETTVSGCLADAGIPPRLVRRVLMVTRTYPIRVKSPEGSTSGFMSQPTTFHDISERSGKNEAEISRTEITTTTRKKRRIGEFDWNLIKKAAFLNGPTDIALTFSDYIDAENESAQRFEQLTPETIKMIEEIEHVTRAKVSLISTGFNTRSIIDRREW